MHEDSVPVRSPGRRKQDTPGGTRPTPDGRSGAPRWLDWQGEAGIQSRKNRCLAMVDSNIQDALGGDHGMQGRARAP